MSNFQLPSSNCMKTFNIFGGRCPQQPGKNKQKQAGTKQGQNRNMQGQYRDNLMIPVLSLHFLFLSLLGPICHYKSLFCPLETPCSGMTLLSIFPSLFFPTYKMSGYLFLAKRIAVCDYICSITSVTIIKSSSSHVFLQIQK